MSNYDATGGEQGWIMKSKLNELRLDAGIARIENQQWLCVLDKETGMMIDPMIGLEKFAELIVRECIDALWTEECHVSDLAVEDYNRKSKKIKEHFGIGEVE